MIDPDRDLYAIPSQDGNDIYFLSLVDILTHYGNKLITTTVTVQSNRIQVLSLEKYHIQKHSSLISRNLILPMALLIV